jgi:Leucine-rich repeat (LRR) protein
MDYETKRINSSSKLFLNCFYIYLAFAGTSVNAFSAEVNFNIFFADDKMFLEKENSLISSPYRIQIDNLSSIDDIQGPQICKSIFSVSHNNLMIKDPSDKLKTYVECSLFLSDSSKKKFKEYRIGINRTFMSWCMIRKKADIGIQKTIDAVMNVVQASDCRDDSIRESLFNARMMNLAGQDLDDLSPIGSLTKLRALWLDNNELSYLNPLSSLKNLIVLSLSNNHISDIQVLEGFKDLQWLFLSTNLIEKIDSLSTLDKIKVLSIKNNNIENIKPLFQFNTNTLILANGNPFQKDACKDFNGHKLGQKQYAWLEKLCKIEPKKKITKLEGSSI